ncbi:unnamed protein product [Clavelina lepadiformis]|uniref:Uncharacterized protein n=1 Tax=Clavelina lepadiformis TaxID=159417 RepID=A0ABP0FUD8_CLALP
MSSPSSTNVSAASAGAQSGQGGFQQLASQSHIELFGFKISGFPALVLGGAVSFSLIIVFADPDSRAIVVNAFADMAKSCVTRISQGSLVVEVVTMGTEAKEKLLQAYSSGKIAEDLKKSLWKDAGDDFKIELATYKKIRTSEKEFLEIQTHTESSKKYRFEGIPSEIILSSSPVLRDESRVIMQLSASKMSMLIVKDGKVDVSFTDEVGSSYESEIKMKHLLDSTNTESVKKSKTFVDEEFSKMQNKIEPDVDIIHELKQVCQKCCKDENARKLLHLYEKIHKLNDDQLTMAAAQIFPEELSLSFIELTKSEVKSLSCILAQVENSLKWLDLTGCFPNPEDLSQIFSAIKKMAGKIATLNISCNIVSGLDMDFLSKVDEDLWMWGCYSAVDGWFEDGSGKRNANQREIISIQQIIDQLNNPDLKVYATFGKPLRSNYFTDVLKKPVFEQNPSTSKPKDSQVPTPEDASYRPGLETMSEKISSINDLISNEKIDEALTVCESLISTIKSNSLTGKDAFDVGNDIIDLTSTLRSEKYSPTILTLLLLAGGLHKQIDDPTEKVKLMERCAFECYYSVWRYKKNLQRTTYRHVISRMTDFVQSIQSVKVDDEKLAASSKARCWLTIAKCHRYLAEYSRAIEVLQPAIATLESTFGDGCRKMWLYSACCNNIGRWGGTQYAAII